MRNIALVLVLQRSCCELLLRHHQEEEPLHPMLLPFIGGLSLDTVFIIALIIAVIYCYFRFRSNNNNPQQIILVPPVSPVLHQNYYPNQNQNQANRYDPPVHQRPQQSQQNAILNYFNNQPRSNIPAEPISADSSNPYLTKSDKMKAQGVRWVAPTNSSYILAREKLADQKCSICTNESKVANMMVSCPDDHCFHLDCLGNYRSKRIVQMGGNGLDKCPNCQDRYSPVVKMYCPRCLKKSVDVNLLDFTHSEKLDSNQIVNKYGSTCDTCVE